MPSSSGLDVTPSPSARFTGGRPVACPLLAAACLSGLLACSLPIDQPLEEVRAPSMDAWDEDNDPTGVYSTLERRWDQLPTTGSAARVPWPAYWWPATDDSINWRWFDGELSPAEKYARAFDAPEFPSFVSGKYGKKSIHGTTSWAGICDGWAAASIMESGPVDEVTVGRGADAVTFYPGDIEALLSLIYKAGNRSVELLSNRCEMKPDVDRVQMLVENPDCRDTNAGTLHLVLTNGLGRFGSSFVMDLITTYEVWNHPVRAYEILEQEYIDDEVHAASLVRPGATTYDFNSEASAWVRVRVDVDYVVESGPMTTHHIDVVDDYTETVQYDYLLELGEDKQSIIGGEYLDTSVASHPDFLWIPLSSPFDAIGDLEYEHVKELLNKSRPFIARATGEGCLVNVECVGSLVCRPTSSAPLSPKTCAAPGAGEIEQEDGAYCGAFCDSNRDCAGDLKCVRWGPMQSGMCLSDGNEPASRATCAP